ncbi:MAG TPA: response regulator [Candidatus Saccharimonadales bacterium]|nr:response regulator [Candidatus Saccharimonadales bacterium]
MAKKILVVDDDLFIRELYIELLKKEGYEVDSAINGEEGLQKLLTGGYDLTLLDLMMPKLNGMGVLEALLTKTPLEKNGPIILLTNRDPDALIEEGLKKGAASFLVKADLNPDQLLENIKKLLVDLPK